MGKNTDRDDSVVKRVNMYFNLDDAQDRMIYDYLDSRSRKGPFAKELIYQHLLGQQLSGPVPKIKIKKDKPKKYEETVQSFSETELDNLDL